MKKQIASHRSHWLLLIALLLTLFSPVVTAQPSSVVAAELQETPTALVSDESISGFTLDSPKLFWWNVPVCIPTLAELEPVNPLTEAISRIATHGSDARRLYYRGPDEVGGTCGLQNVQFSPRSNLIADDDYLYWMAGNGLVRLSTDANPGDEPEVLNGTLTSNGGAELVQNETHIYAILRGGNENQTMTVRRIAKTDGTANTITFNVVTGNTVRQLGIDSEYLYWVADGTLRRYDLANGGSAVALTDDVTSYYVEGPRESCTIACTITRYIYLAKGKQIYRYNNTSESLSAALYTSPAANATINEIVGDAQSIFFFERRQLTCDPTCVYNSVLIRTTRNVTQAASIYSADTSFLGPRLGLASDGTFLFWRFEGIQRLPNNAAALPMIDMEITGIEVTQGIQDLDNSVPLIANRRTFVRVYVRTKGTNASVPGVTARLIKVGATQFDSGLLPINNVGPTITVVPSPDRTVINQSFLFELPWAWTTGSATLQARLNPFQYPLEPSYGADNQRSIDVTFLPSPRLEVQFVRWGYTLNDIDYYPRLEEDVELTYSWIRRVYPLASSPGSADDPSAGFRPALMTVLDPELGARVDRSHPDCEEYLEENEQGEIEDRRNLCASKYTNFQMGAMRDELGIGLETFMYGMISDAAGIFPRGQACCSDNVSSGPVGEGRWGWDEDASYGDWYAGHEIGHTLGRKHPAQGNECGHGAADPDYPYAGAKIGPANGTLAGFDAGDPAFGIPRAVLPASQWADLMSYCDYQWISDYTYEAMYERMMEVGQVQRNTAPAQLNGDFLSVYGSINPEAGTATIMHTNRRSSVANIPPLVGGPYAIKLLGNGALLAQYAFTPANDDDSEDAEQYALLSFGQIVRFMPGTDLVQIVRLSDGAVLDSQSVSANAPTISNVQMAAPAPVTGTANLSWNSSDADGDTLSFDVFASRDSGATFQPLVLNVSGNSTPLDTSLLGGGSTIFRVIASDGLLSAQAESAPITIANKPPQPAISSPGNNASFQYGQLINFSGEAFDLQDGSVAAENLVWSSADGTLGKGTQLSVADLPVGSNVITLTAKNSVGLQASTNITVIVEDDLSLPGPQLEAGPTVVGWQVAEGTSASQNAQINIANSGGGELTWQASSDAPWLTVSQSNGSAPAQLTLSADPTAIGTNKSVQATITIQSNGGSISIPVSLTIGNAHSISDDTNPPIRRQQQLYVPMIWR